MLVENVSPAADLPESPAVGQPLVTKGPELIRLLRATPCAPKQSNETNQFISNHGYFLFGWHGP
eukprot:scaffold29949_cov13-Tisochrysis_lutea.AAC.1